ncbi:MAG: hypothetical protein ABS894_06000, partial [Aerococcus urinaeequi]
IVIPPAIFFYYSTLFDSRFKTLQQNLNKQSFGYKLAYILQLVLLMYADKSLVLRLPRLTYFQKHFVKDTILGLFSVILG